MDYDDYDYDEYDELDDYYEYDDGVYYDGSMDCPKRTIRNVVRNWLMRLRWKIWAWRHKDDASDIPF